MLKYKGAYETELGSVYCSNCGCPMKDWEKMSTEAADKGGMVYVFRCKKCKKRIEVYNSKG